MPSQVMASWPATFLMGPGAASGVALINSVGSVGGFLGPYILGAPTSHADAPHIQLVVAGADECISAFQDI